MTKQTEIICAHCGKHKLINTREYNRQVKKGRTLFFCNTSCSAKYYNNDRKSPEIIKTCPVCGKEFKTFANRNEATFCSRSCASKGSVTPYRREKAKQIGKELVVEYPPTIDKVHDVILSREVSKYTLLEEKLSSLSIKHEFEYILENKLFDLAIIDTKTFIEFDGPDHLYEPALSNDIRKEAIAQKNGWSVKRIKVKPNERLTFNLIEEYL